MNFPRSTSHSLTPSFSSSIDYTIYFIIAKNQSRIKRHPVISCSSYVKLNDLITQTLIESVLYIHSTHTHTLTYCIRFPQRARAACAQWKLFTLMSIYNNWPIALISRYDQTKSCPGQARKNTTARGVRLCECVCVRVSVCMWFDHESPDKSSIKSAWLFISKCLGFTLIKSDGQLIYIGSINGIIIYIQEIEIKYTFCLERHERSEW